MPIITCEYATTLDTATRKQLAESLTGIVNDVIASPLELISIVLRQPDKDQMWVAAKPSEEVLIFCYIRAGRPVHLRTELAKRVSKVWNALVGTPEASIEVLVMEIPAVQVVRGGERLPEPPLSVTAEA